MNAADEHVGYVVIDEAPKIRPSIGAKRETPMRKRPRGKVLLAAGILAIVAASFMVALPEIGAMAAFTGTILAGISSAGVTLLARR
jgi:hypothetical protein